MESSYLTSLHSLFSPLTVQLAEPHPHRCLWDVSGSGPERSLSPSPLLSASGRASASSTGSKLSNRYGWSPRAEVTGLEGLCSVLRLGGVRAEPLRPQTRVSSALDGGVQGPGHGEGLAVSSLTRPPFWRLSLGLHILRGAEEGNLRAVGQVLKGPCGLFWLRSLAAVLLGFPLWGRNVALLPVGFLAFLCVCVDTVSSTRAAEIKWQLPHPGAPQWRYHLPCSPSGGDDS